MRSRSNVRRPIAARLRGAACVPAVVCLLLARGVSAADPPAKSGGSQAAPAKTDESGRYEFRADHDPNGIGKFYLGREIAHVMGFGPRGTGAAWLERTEREEEENLTLLVKSLRLRPGITVADIGSGSGVVALRIAEQIGPDGTVLAVDIQQEMLDRLLDRAKRIGATNVKPVLGTDRSPKLAPGTVDLAVMVDVYHEFAFPYEMLGEIAKALKTGGRVAFVEYRLEDPTVPIKRVHKMSVAQVRREAGLPEFGLKWVETVGALPRQHVIVFEKTAPQTE
jgi:SAM-dependent methyltransferase